MNTKEQVKKISNYGCWLENKIFEEACYRDVVGYRDCEWDKEKFALVPDEGFDHDYIEELEGFNKLLLTEEFQEELVKEFFEEVPELEFLWDLDSCKFTVTQKKGDSCEGNICVRCEHKTHHIDFWVDCWRGSKNEDWELDWNQYIFGDNPIDNMRNTFQSNSDFAQAVFDTVMDELY